MFIIEYRKSSTMSYLRIKSKFFVWFASRHGHKWTSYVTKMTLNVSMGGLWGDFTTIFWIVEYLQRPIYIWNKIWKRIMSQCGMDFQIFPLHIANNSQHFEPIQYVNGLSRSSPTFQVNDSKFSIDLNDFPSFLELVMQQPPI